MPFSARNARYLRISPHTILPLYIYLDDKHIEWMSDYILQHVLADLKPLIGPKLRSESNMSGTTCLKKATVDTHRGDTYQFAYFIRKTEPHVVLIKSRNFIPASVPVHRTGGTEGSMTQKKRKVAKSSKGGKRGREKRKQVSESDADPTAKELEEGSSVVSENNEPRRSQRKRAPPPGVQANAEVQEDNDVEITDAQTSTDDEYIHEEDGTPALPPQGDQLSSSGVLDMDTDEEKPKMTLTVSFQGFKIYDKCLCLIIEPWPPLRNALWATSRAPSLAPSLGLHEMRMASIAPMVDPGRGNTPGLSSGQMPLFLPETDPRRSLTPAPLPSRIHSQVPLFGDSTQSQPEEEETYNGMMAFSQALKSAGDERAGSPDEDEDGEAFLDDADERKGS